MLKLYFWRVNGSTIFGDKALAALFVLWDQGKKWRVFKGIRFCAEVEAKELQGIGLISFEGDS